jgi:hypothetical protein
MTVNQQPRLPIDDAQETRRQFTDNWLDREVTSLARLWNRSDRQSRLEFLEMANDSDGGLIDP